MFFVTDEQLQTILTDYGFDVLIQSHCEIQTYDYEDKTFGRQIRCILKIILENEKKLIIKLKSEHDVQKDSFEQQCVFAMELLKRDIPTAKFYQHSDRYVSEYLIDGCHVLVSVEEFVEGEIQAIDEKIAYEVGALLAKTHVISEDGDLHVDARVIFNPFEANDLFFVEEFKSLGSALSDKNQEIYCEILQEYERKMSLLKPVLNETKYAVQGDISDSNLYMDSTSGLGIFDFNRSGDNYLFCDAVMQGVFLSRLMKVAPDMIQRCEHMKIKPEELILREFFLGYQKFRAFTDEQKQRIPILYSIISAFWGFDILFDEESLTKLVESADEFRIQRKLSDIKSKIFSDFGYEFAKFL